MAPSSTTRFTAASKSSEPTDNVNLSKRSLYRLRFFFFITGIPQVATTTPMSNRLPELLRQRALLQEHLAWLDREIAAEQGSAAPAPVPSPLPFSTAGTSLRDVRPSTPTTNLTSAATPPPLPQLPADVEKIVAQYRRDPGSLTQDTRRGCLIIFWIGLAATLLICGLVYWLYGRHLGRWW